MNDSTSFSPSSSHALLAPSAAHRWMLCPSSPWLEAPYPPTNSALTKEGQDAHQLAALCLTSSCDTSAYLDRKMDKGNIVSKKMAKAIQIYVDQIRKAACGHLMFIEREVPLTPFTGEEEAVGTADAVILRNVDAQGSAELQIHDLKFGRGIRTEAKDNEQLALYALGAKHAFREVAEFKCFRLAIHQPRLSHYSEWICTFEDLQAFAKNAAQAARAVYSLEKMPLPFLYKAAIPGKEQCRFCRAKKDCPAYARFFKVF